MTKRITKLTTEQHAAMATHAEKWIQRGLDLSPVDWAAWERGARACYGHAGIPFPDRVVRVPSPLVGAVAAPLAAYLIGLRRHGAVDGAVGDAVGDAVRDAVDDAVHGAVGGAVDDAVRGAVHGAVDGAVDGAVGDAVHGAVGDAVRDAVDDAVHGAVRGAVGDAVGDAVHGAVRGAVGDAVDGAVRGAVDDAVGDAVRDAVDGAVLQGAYSAIKGGQWNRLWGQWWIGWQAWAAFFRDECDLELDSDMWERSYAYEQASTAGFWWPYREFVMVSDRPTELHLEQVGPAGWGSHRLHREDGPAIAWRDGWALHYWHGTRVPADLIEGAGWTVDRIMHEPNAEIRRCAIERIGWDRFIADAHLQQVGDTVPDPGNAGHTLALYDIPERLYDEPVRVLLCTNGTVERDGTRRRFGLTVPGSIPTPLAAAAWGYGLNPTQYAQAERRA